MKKKKRKKETGGNDCSCFAADAVIVGEFFCDRRGVRLLRLLHLL
jgi:hypothetical protein